MKLVDPALPLSLSDSLLANLHDGVFRLDGRGRVRSINRAAQPWLRACLSQTEHLAALTAAAARGVLKLPVKLELFKDSSKPPAEVWFDRDGEHNYLLLVITGDCIAKAPDNRCGDFIALLDGNARGEIDRLRSLLDNLGAPAEAMQQQAGELSALLGDISHLTELYQRDEVFANERFGLAPLLAGLLPELPRQEGAQAVRYDYQEGENVGQVYGHRSWLRQAVLSLIGRLGEGCPPGHSVRITLRQLGDFVVVTSRVMVDRERLRGLVSGSGVPQQINDPLAGPGFGLRIAICQRIIDLHGGTLKIEYDQPPHIASFTLSLATGLPINERSRVSCADCRITFQALEYARDLADLMAVKSSAGSDQV
jgi:hypothetical protein